MYQMYTPVPLDAQPALDRVPPARIRPAKLVRTLFTLSSLVSGAWMAANAVEMLHSMCSRFTAVAATCASDQTMHLGFLRYAAWGLLACSAPIAGMAFRRWWAWVVPPIACVSIYVLIAGDSAIHFVL